MSGVIVVGVSPSSGSPEALRWAADEARLRKATVRAVLAWHSPRPPAAPGAKPTTTLASSTDELTADPAEKASARLDEFVETALGATDGVQREVVKGGVVTALLSAAADAQLLVVGEPRRGRLNSVKTSLVAPQVVSRAPCPVVVMPSSSASG